MTKDEGTTMPLTRDALYAMVWSEPMLKVAARYNVSSTYMARVCKFMNVPRPPRGYWAMMVAGKTLPIPPLPDAQPADLLTWSRDGSNVYMGTPLPRPPSETPGQKKEKRKSNITHHPLVREAQSLFKAGRYPHETGYLKPEKKLLIDLIVTETGINKALTFVSRFFLQCEEYGYHVVIAPKHENFQRSHVDEHEVPKKNQNNYHYNSLWFPYRCTVVYVGTVAIGLTIIEMAEEEEVRYIKGKYIRERDYIPPKQNRHIRDYSWTTKKDFPTGRLCLQAYSPYPRAQWVKRWQETKVCNLISQIKLIIKELEQAAVHIARLVEEGERQAEIEHQRWEAQQEQWRREKEEQRAIEAHRKSRDEIIQIINDWNEASNIERFFKDAEQQATQLSDNEKKILFERLKLAREMVGTVDALKRFLTWRAPNER